MRFVGERGFLIANKGEISQRSGEDCKLARRIAANGGNGGSHDTNLDTNDTNYDMTLMQGLISEKGFWR